MPDVLSFLAQHEGTIVLLVLAFVATMPEHRPHFQDFLDWAYGWIHDGLKAFVSFRSPQSPKSESK